MCLAVQERSSELCLGTGAAQLEAPIVAAGPALTKPESGISKACRLAPTLGPVPCGVGVLCGTSLPVRHLLSGGNTCSEPWEQPRSLSPVQSAAQGASSQQGRLTLDTLLGPGEP